MPLNAPILHGLIDELKRLIVETVVHDNPYAFLDLLRPTGTTVRAVGITVAKLIRAEILPGTILDGAVTDVYVVNGGPDAVEVLEYPVGTTDVIAFNSPPGEIVSITHTQLDSSRRASLPEMITYASPATIELGTPEGTTIRTVGITEV